MSSRSERRSRVKRGARGQRLVEDLVEACKSGQVGKAKKLLRQGADPNGVHDDCTPLFAASIRGHVVVVCTLLKHPSLALDWANRRGATALYAASQEGHAAVVEALLVRGADPTRPARGWSRAARMSHTATHTTVSTIVPLRCSSSAFAWTSFLLAPPTPMESCRQATRCAKWE